MSQTRLEQFVREQCFPILGASVAFAEFHARFLRWLPTELRPEWNANRTARAIPAEFPRGRRRGSAHRVIANLSFVDAPASARPYVGPDGALTCEPLDPEPLDQ